LETIVALADILVDEFDVGGFLHELTARCVDLLDVDAAGLILVDGGGVLRVMASSTERVQTLELCQIQQDEGPCLDCYRSGTQVSEDDLSSADGRWPAFSRQAVQVGYRSVQALPMRLRGQRLGALNLLRARPGPVSVDHVRLGQAFADLATISIVSQRRAEESELLTGQLQQALDSRVVIEQATGVIAGRTGLDVDQAFGVLRSAARRRSRPLSELARDVVSGTVQVESLH
jgi:hypothetical protein